MKKKSDLKWMLLGVLLFVSIAFYGYRQKSNVRNERVACSERCKEMDDTKTLSDMPIWETLSRYLIALNK